MGWLLLIIFFILSWIEISLFVYVANIFGIPFTLLLVLLTSYIGLLIVKNQSIKNFILIKKKLIYNEMPTKEIIKIISLIISGFLLLLPGFFTDLCGLLLLIPPIQNYMTLRIIKNLIVWINFNNKFTIDGEFERKHNKYD
ncbi:exclusion suppressor FxsA [Candidatus Pantoea edessiphila]|uniref:Exclusion suppressor FxsA n=1 Tax=Candidatus Pantoea edessiphila TaxID=2044610 RepID=A0A2P5SY82_9GAMM|nr:FxsA family protein [Candidatus Pantoea edessiphila]MBK4775889.1 exclusion suppressor FxsA [Pantoea sp. Edef]PPI87307.1 exclusion suppressor FxsA [Candidatus Pantoea edessiphila]